MWENEAMPFGILPSPPPPRKARPLDYGPFENRGAGDHEATCFIAYEPGIATRGKRSGKASDPAIRKNVIIV